MYIVVIDLDRDNFMSAQDALKYGLIDEIVEPDDNKLKNLCLPPPSQVLHFHVHIYIHFHTLSSLLYLHTSIYSYIYIYINIYIYIYMHEK